MTYIMDMSNEFTSYTDSRCNAIEQNLGAAVAKWADDNSAGWVLDLLADGRTNWRGPQAGLRICDQAADLVPESVRAIQAAGR